MVTLALRTDRRNQLVDITDAVARELPALGAAVKAVVIASPHTTAGIIVNEGFDPDVAEDLLRRLEHLVPHRAAGDHHAEGNSDSHLKAALVGTSVVVPVDRGRLALGRWQRVFFCEFDGPRSREVLLSSS